MILSVSIQSWEQNWTKLKDDPDAYAKLRKHVPMLPVEWKQYVPALIVDDQGLRALGDANLTITIEKEQVGESMLVKLQDQIQKIGGEFAELQQCIAKNAVVQVAIPDIGLMLIDDVVVLENACTDNLRVHLDGGWRILAVCPPCAQRRPDYVLGRRKHK